MNHDQKKKEYKKLSKEELIEKLIDTEIQLKLAEVCIAELDKKYVLIEKE